MKYIECPEIYDGDDKCLFLAGGITGGTIWQTNFTKLIKDENLVVLNPRRKEYVENDIELDKNQIKWEFDHLKKADVAIFWFPNETLCPITLYELGKLSAGGKPIFIGVDPKYVRKKDVELQTRLIRPEINIVYSLEDLAEQVSRWVYKTNVKKTIGLLGGSFNPVHNSHLAIVKNVLDKQLVDEIWLIPCKKHAFDKPLESAEKRLAMINLAIKDMKNVKICDVELKSEGKNYTLDTLRKLRRDYSHKFLFIIGSDILRELDKWEKKDQLLKECEFIISRRKDFNLDGIEKMYVRQVIDKEVESVSSTEIRKKIRARESVKNFVPENVNTYISENRCYEND